MPTSNELSPVTQQHVDRAVDSLVDEFGDTHSRETIEHVTEDSARSSRAAQRSTTYWRRWRIASPVSG